MGLRNGCLPPILPSWISLPPGPQQKGSTVKGTRDGALYFSVVYSNWFFGGEVFLFSQSFPGHSEPEKVFPFPEYASIPGNGCLRLCSGHSAINDHKRILSRFDQTRSHAGCSYLLGDHLSFPAGIAPDLLGRLTHGQPVGFPLWDFYGYLPRDFFLYQTAGQVFDHGEVVPLPFVFNGCDAGFTDVWAFFSSLGIGRGRPFSPSAAHLLFDPDGHDLYGILAPV